MPLECIGLILGFGAIGRHAVHALEFNPRVQYRFHLIMAYFWIGWIVAVPFIRVFNHEITGLFIMEASLYANFATEFGAMSSALAAMRGTKEFHELAQDVDDIHDALPGTWQYDHPEV